MNPVYVSYGGGVNSTAMLIGMFERGIGVDLIMFADTGGEKPETYDYVVLFNRWLVERGFPTITVVSEPRRTLEQECIDGHTLPGIVRGVRSCSDKYKIRPQNRYLTEWTPACEAWYCGEKVMRLVGFDAGEPWRAKDYSGPRYDVRFPLIEWQWDRDKCVEAIERVGLRIPPKSSCFYCPEMREKEIVQLHQVHPHLYSRAIAMEDGNTQFYDVRGLANKYSWRQIVDYHDRQVTLPWTQPDRLPCVCFDGE